jgi:hypothetical protein
VGLPRPSARSTRRGTSSRRAPPVREASARPDLSTEGPL